METKNQWKAWIYLGPAVLLLLVFTFYPMINTIGISFLNGYKTTFAAAGVDFAVGVQNYVDVITGNKQFIAGFTNTMLIAFITVPISTILSLLIAVGLNSIKPLRSFLQTIYFLPYVTNSVAIGMVFAMIFDKTVNNDGLFNMLLHAFGMPAESSPTWIASAVDLFSAQHLRNLFVLCIYSVWNALPFKILIFMGALQSVNKQYYDAAKVDGTPQRRVFTKITVPLISPMVLYVVVTGFIGAFKEYSSVVGIFGENLRIYNMNTMVGFIYDSMTGQFTGRAAAGAVVLFLVILLFTGIQFLVSKKRVHY